MTDLERLIELVQSERDGFDWTFELTGRTTDWGSGFVAGLDRAAEIVAEVISEEIN